MTTTQRERYIPRAEVAKLIRAQLKRQFPGVKFSVRGRSYAGGGSIDVYWTDGPTWSAVNDVISGYGSSGFDGMIDGSYVRRPWFCPEHGARVAEVYGHGQGLDGPKQSRCCAQAELVNSGAGYVHASRELSDAFRATIVEVIERQTGESYDPNKRVWDQWMSDLVSREANKTDGPIGAPAPSAR